MSTGDLHFCAGYDEEIAASMKQIMEAAARHRVDLIAIAGDIFERHSDPAGRNIAAHWIQALANMAGVMIIKGNHDVPGDLRIFELLKSQHKIWVYEEPSTVIFSRVEGEMVAVIAFPWLTKANWQALHPEASKEFGDHTVSQLALKWLRNEVVLHPADKHVFIGHVMINGARAQNHQKLIGEGVTFGSYDLPEAGFFAGIFGHIHLRQQFENPNFFYNGSVAALDYGEEPEKFFSILDTQKTVDAVTFIPLQVVDRYSIDAKWENAILDINFHPGRVKGARVRVVLEYAEGEDLAMGERTVQEAFDGLEPLELKITPQVRPRDAVRAASLAKAQTMADKLRVLWEATGSELDQETKDDMLEKLAELEGQIATGKSKVA